MKRNRLAYAAAMSVVVCALAAVYALALHRAPPAAPEAPSPRIAKLLVKTPVEASPAPAKASPAPDGAMGKREPRKDVDKAGVLGALGGAGGGASNTFGPGGLGTGVNQALAGLGGAGDARGAGALHGAGKSVGYGDLGLRGTGAGGGGMGTLGLGVSGVGGGIPRRAAVGGRLSGAQARALEDTVSAGEGYRDWGVNGFTLAKEDRLSTFAIDVDTASYAIARRKLREGTLPPAESVRVEEFLNYFHYDYPAPTEGPFAVYLDAAPSPFHAGRQLLRVGLQAKPLSLRERKSVHLTFLVDVSGSMQSPDKLPLAQRSLRILLDNLKDGDTVALVTYAGGVRLVLPPTGLEQKGQIAAAIDALSAGGSTAMSSGLTLAYQQAMKTLNSESESRVLVLSDGDANVGSTTHEQILSEISRYVKEGVTLSTVGFGMGNYKDALMEQLADKGNGNYFYIDTVAQARRVFQEQLGGTLEVLAQDVKVQVDFDPRLVRRYRLVGYENRDVADKDFRNDRVDAGELGAGHTVTALYEVELEDAGHARSGAWARAHVRAKPPRGTTASESTFALEARSVAARFEDASADLRFAAAVMATAEVLRQSAHGAELSLRAVEKIAREAAGQRADRAELLELLERVQALKGRVARQ